MLRVLPTAVITARMLVRHCSLLQHKKLTNTKEKNKRKREPSPESSSSDSENSSSSEESVEKCNSTKSHRFQITSKSESHQWELPGEMVDYVNQSLIWALYSRKWCRRKSSGTTACPWECQRHQKIGRFCKVHNGAERTISKPRHNHGKITTENFRCSVAPF